MYKHLFKIAPVKSSELYVPCRPHVIPELLSLRGKLLGVVGGPMTFQTLVIYAYAAH